MEIVEKIVVMALIGFIAQMVDGTLGMGFGVISSSFLLVIGVPPALASSSVHLSKVFTNGASALAHWRFQNIDRRLLRSLLPAGIVGGILGALVITNLSPEIARPLVAVYLFITGIVIVRKAFRQPGEPRKTGASMFALGGAGGFLDAIGGGGWGPVVTSTLMARGNEPRLSIGSSNVAEFFVAIAISATFFTRLSPSDIGPVVLGLIIGGVIGAAPAAYLCGRLPRKLSMVVVGLTVVVLAFVIL